MPNYTLPRKAALRLTATVTRWNEHRASLVHPGTGDMKFGKEDMVRIAANGSVVLSPEDYSEQLLMGKKVSYEVVFIGDTTRKKLQHVSIVR